MWSCQSIRMSEKSFFLINNEQLMNKKLQFWHLYAILALWWGSTPLISVPGALRSMKNACNW